MNMAIRPVSRIKHIVDSSATVADQVTLPITLIDAVDSPIIANTDEVETGAKVNGIFLNVQVQANATVVGAIPNVYMAVYRNPGQLITTSLNPVSLGDDVNKKQVIHQEMIMFENVKGGNTKTLFKGVIVIPKGYRRFGAKDRLILVLRSNAVDFIECVQCIYKEFR